MQRLVYWGVGGGGGVWSLYLHLGRGEKVIYCCHSRKVKNHSINERGMELKCIEF